MKCSASAPGVMVGVSRWLGIGLVVAAWAAPAWAVPLLSPADAIIAINASGKGGGSNYPGGEPPANAIDGNVGTKYLNFGHQGSGFIVTPGSVAAIESMLMRTANDDPMRDPTTWEVWGYDGVLSSADNSTGLAEAWTLIDSGSVALPDDRDVLGPVIPVSGGGVGYQHYKVLFPTLKDVTGGATNSMQINEVQLYKTYDADPGNLAGQEILAPGNPILAVRYGNLSRFPAAEGPANLLDNDFGSKYLNFGKDNTGAIITLSGAAATIDTMQLTTANDFEGRDPASYELWGTNDAIVSELNSDGLGGENWTLVSSGALTLPDTRLDDSTVVAINGTEAFQSYKIVFPTLKDSAGVNSFQLAGLQFDGTPVPEPGSMVLVMMGGFGLLAVARRRGRRASA